MRVRERHTTTLFALALLLSTLVAPACGGTNESDGSPASGGAGGGAAGAFADGGARASDCEVAAVEQCLVTQKACVLEGASPRCEPCPAGQYAVTTGVCEDLEGTVLEREFAEFTVAAGEEVKGLCQSWTLENEAELWINAVELEQREQSHHSNWLFVPDDQFDGPDGVWPCRERGYKQITAAIAGGVLYAQSTQAAREVQKFPSGVAVRVPPRSRVIGDVHLLNTTAQAVTGTVTLRLYSLDPSEVTVKLAPFHLTYETLEIPPNATSRFTGECDLDTQHNNLTGRPFGGKVYFVLPHTHALGTRYFLEILGGPRDGATVIDVAGFDSEARGRPYAPPVDLTGATGFRFGCEFVNPRSVEVNWGFGDQEMCENLGFMESEVAFESSVSEAIPSGTDGTTQLFTGACSSIVFPFAQDKPGGPGG